MKILFAFALIFPVAIFAQTQRLSEKSSVLSFKGESSYCDLPYSADLNAENNFTIELWALHSHWGSKTLSTLLYSKGLFTGYAFFANGITGHWEVATGNGNNWLNIQGPKIVPNVWTHLAITYTNSILHFYVNGMIAGSVVGKYSSNVTSALRCGMNADGSSSQWFGSVDEVRIWKTVRTNDELLSTMFEQKNIIDTSLVLYWKFNEPSGSVIRDMSGHGHHGMLHNAFREYLDRPKGKSILWIRNDEISFPNIASGATQTAEIVLENRGSLELEITSITSDSPEFFVAAEKFVISSVQTRSVIVRFAPRTSGKKNATITVHHAGLGGEQIIHLSGSCAVPEITSIVPSIASVGENVKIFGRFLSSERHPAKVFVGTIQAKITSFSPKQLSFEVPAGIAHGNPHSLHIVTDGMVVSPRTSFRLSSSVNGIISTSSFSQPKNIQASSPISKIISADFDGDGAPDVLSLHPSDSSVVIWKNNFFNGKISNGNQPLVVAGKLFLHQQSDDILAADFDCDGKIDLVTANPGSASVTFYRNMSKDGIIQFVESVTLATQPGASGLLADDFDDNGKIDLFVAGRDDWTVTLFRNESVSGTFSFTPEVMGVWAKPTYLASGLFDDDGMPDLAVTTGIDNLLSIYKTRNDQQNLTWTPQERHTSSQLPGKIIGADIDGDEKTDLVVLDFSGNIYLYKNISVGNKISFSDRVTIPVGSMLSDICTGDVDGDGKPELIVASGLNRTVTVYRNNALYGEITPTSFDRGVTYDAGDSVVSLLLADMDMDGKPDIVTAGAKNKTVTILYNGVTRNIDWMLVFFIGLGFIMAAGSIGWYVTNKRLKKKVRALEHEQVIERERSRIARDLHDELGARLTEITYMTENARKNSYDTKQSEEHFEEIGSTVRNIVDSFREIVWAVNPQQDSLDSLVDFLDQYAVRFLTTVKIRCLLNVPANIPAMPLTSDARHSIFMAIKEALNNIAKHSEATEVKFSVMVHVSSITISLEDNGKGFSSEGVNRFGNGLTTMKERLDMVNGTVTMTSSVQKGTAVHFTIPLIEVQQQ